MGSYDSNFCWHGSAFGSVKDETEETTDYRLKICAQLAAHATIIFSPYHGEFLKNEFIKNNNLKEFTKICELALRETAGAWRFLISLLAVRNQTEFVYAKEQTVKKTRMVHGRPLPYLNFSLITTDAPHHVVVKHVQKRMTHNITMRHHGVSGHYRHSHIKGDPNCDHAYVFETKTREVCVCCGAKRWWVSDYTRGDATVGVTVADYFIE